MRRLPDSCHIMFHPFYLAWYTHVHAFVLSKSMLPSCKDARSMHAVCTFTIQTQRIGMGAAVTVQ